MLYSIFDVLEQLWQLLENIELRFNAMDTLEIFLFIFVISFAGFRLYQKYVKKPGPGTGTFSKQSGTSMPFTQKDDDYEPYSKK